MPNQLSPTNNQVPHLPALTGSKNILVITVGRPDTLSKIVFIRDKLTPTFQSVGNNFQSQNKNAPTNNAKRKDDRRTGRVFYTQVDVTTEWNPVLMGMFLIAHHPVQVFFDTGASHTFLSETFAMNHNIPIQ